MTKTNYFKIMMGLFILGWLCISGAQVLKKGGFELGGKETDGPTSNAINDILITENHTWIATGRGLTHTDDNGESWEIYTQKEGIGRGGVSALAYRDNTLWVATAFDTLTEVEGFLPAGGGLGYTTDFGASWIWMDQPVDPPDDSTDYKSTTTNIQNLTYDIALTDSAVWITSFGGGLRRSTSMGETWEVVTVDGYPFDALGYLTHRAFSVIYDGKNIWVGTAGGIHKSSDEGQHWTTFNHQNQPEGISGNFVVAIAHQQVKGGDIIWAATIEAVEAGEYRAISMTKDGGLTWGVMLEGEFAHNFAVHDSVVYVATDNGLFKTLDFGKTWAVFPQIVDTEADAAIYTTEINCVGVDESNMLWVGSSDGLARSSDNGETWKIYRAFQVTGEGKTPKTYAYPNPFSPLRHNLMGGEGVVRFQYRTHSPTRVTLCIYDFAMQLVRTVVESKERPIPGDYAEIWNGRNEIGEMVANGVYFYEIVLEKEESFWGKVMVVN
jgi:photosystem II stability/assembly factor-like uncharacterized protein